MQPRLEKASNASGDIDRVMGAPPVMKDGKFVGIDTTLQQRQSRVPGYPVRDAIPYQGGSMNPS